MSESIITILLFSLDWDYGVTASDRCRTLSISIKGDFSLAVVGFTIRSRQATIRFADIYYLVSNLSNKLLYSIYYVPVFYFLLIFFVTFIFEIYLRENCGKKVVIV